MNTAPMDQALLESVFKTLVHLTEHQGTRLTREQVCTRLGVHRNTLATYIKDRKFPAAGKDGRWLVSEVMRWEAGR